jgi:molybdate transport system regulatory protein
MNRFPGRIAAVEAFGSVAIVEVQVGPHLFTATLLGSSEAAVQWPVGSTVMLLFKETEVALAKDLSGLISLRNRMPARITALEPGQILTRVWMQMDGLRFSSLITSRSAQAMQLAVGQEVEGLVKSNEVSLQAEAAP